MLDTTSITEHVTFTIYMVTCVSILIREVYVQIYIYFLSCSQEYAFLCVYKYRYIVCTHMCVYLYVYIYTHTLIHLFTSAC